MDRPLAPEQCRRLLVVIPNWAGDVVLATPVLAALRAHFRQARITFLMRRYVEEIVAGGDWHDSAAHWPSQSGPKSVLRLAGRLRMERFDLALLLTNSFRSALVAWWARVPRRVGYRRDARGWMLTDRLKPFKRDGEFVPAPVLAYYARLAEHIGCPVMDMKLRLGITPEQERQGAELMDHYGIGRERPYAVVNPGAAYGAAKCWLPDRFAELCDRLVAERGLQPVLVGAPREVPLLADIAEKAAVDVVCCADPGTTLGSLKPLVRDAALLVCNDTGPRHYGNAFGVPTVTIFGPTHQAWTDTDYADEVKLQMPVGCGPCQLRTCPIDLRCMTAITTELVMGAIADLLDGRQPTTEPPSVPAGASALPPEQPAPGQQFFRLEM